MSVIERFLKYISHDTTSVDGTEEFPDVTKQLILAQVLAKELTELGCRVHFDNEHCYVYAMLEATTDCTHVPRVGFISHMDTSPAASGIDVKPRIIQGFDGTDILLNPEKNIFMKVSDFPELGNYIGQDLIVTDGTTLLGADDKAGIAEIMAMVEYFHNNPTLSHGPILAAFTPNEEVGFGTEYFDIPLFGANFAYTVDGGALGEIEYENFNAASVAVTVNGRSVHPGDAKNKMQNAILIAQEFQSLLPVAETPMHTEGYEGFYHLDRINGTVEKTVMNYIIRDHDSALFARRKDICQNCADFLNQKYGDGTIEIKVTDSYYNMREIIEQNMFLIDIAKTAMTECEVAPRIVPIRGGTDGARLSFMGLPCPNLSTGGMNFHGRFEYIPVQSMEKMVDVLIKLVEKVKGLS